MVPPDVTSPPRVAVVGANGHTGAFVVAELERRGLAPVAVGRDAERLASRGFGGRGVPARVAATDDPGSLDRALDGVAAVINCAGPFLDTARAVAAAAVRAGAHYLDVTAEQASATATLDEFHAPAVAAGITVLPGVAFYGGFADLLLGAVTSGWDRIDEVRIGIALDGWHPTAGTRATGRRNTARRLVIDGGALVPLAEPVPRGTLTFPAPFGARAVTEVPFSEVPLIARHLPVGRLRTWLTDVALDDLRDPTTPPPQPVDASGRSAQQFLVEVVATGPAGARRVTARGRDIYALTASLVVDVAHRLLEREHARPGAFAPGEILDAPALVAAFDPAVAAIEITDVGAAVSVDGAGQR